MRHGISNQRVNMHAAACGELKHGGTHTCSQRLACGTSGGTSESSFGAPNACTDEAGVSSNITGPRRQAPSECFER